MKKRGLVLFFAVVISLFCVLSFSSAYYINVTNANIDTQYSPYENFSGIISVNLTGVDSSLNISSELGTMNLRDFLDRNAAAYSCNPTDCSNSYGFLGGDTSQAISFPQQNLFGFVLFGLVDSAGIRNFNFGLSSSFGYSNQTPLILTFFDSSNSYTWKYNKTSNYYLRSVSYGCYNPGVSQQTNNLILSNLTYCENIPIPETSSVMIGADFAANDSKQLRMTIYNSNNLGSLGGCDVNASSSSCVINLPLISGNYFVCISPKNIEDTTYTLYSENSGVTCGYMKPTSSFSSILYSNSTKDYSIFAKTPMFDQASNFTVNTTLIPTISSRLQQYINSKYSGNCTGGCVVPIKIDGVPQNIVVNHASLSYITSDSTPNDHNIYNIVANPTYVSYNGNLDLSLLGFNISSTGNKLIHFRLGGINLFQANISVLPAPIINSIYPMNPPAGVPVIFTAGYSSQNNVSRFVWNFGDGDIETTMTNTVKHIYSNISSYTLNLTVYDINNFSTTKSFGISSVSPANMINATLAQKTASLNNAISDISKLPSWYQNEVSKQANITFYQDELTTLGNQYNVSYSDTQYLNIALDLSSLDVPSSVYIADSSTLPLIVENLDVIDPSAVQIVGGGSFDNSSIDSYKQAILQWQQTYFNASVVTTNISVLRDNTDREGILEVYSIYANSKADGESYFIINRDRDDLTFRNEDNSIKKAGSATAVVFNAGEQKTIEFYSSEPVTFFASTRLDLLPTSALPANNCNNNDVCDSGENSTTCPNDCKPIGRIIFYVIIVFIFGLFVYTGVQIWYNTRYEGFLFKDRKYLYNLLMFVANARARGMGDDQIKDSLKKQGWNGEQVTYIIKKSKGERTGMFEIIPISKISAAMRAKKAEKNFISNPNQKLVNWG